MFRLSLNCLIIASYSFNRKIASSSKDGDIRIWDTWTGVCLMNLAGHKQGVSCIRFGGMGLIYSASQVRCVELIVIHVFPVYEFSSLKPRTKNVTAI